MALSGLVLWLPNLAALGFAVHFAAATQTTTHEAAVRPPAPAAVQDAKAVGEVIKIRDTALAIASRKASASEETISSLGRDLRSKFDLVAITQSVLGPSWDRATEDERYDAVQAFSDILAQAAVTQFAKYQNLPFAVRGVLHIRDGDLVVVSQFTQADGRTVRVDWRLRPKNNAMKFVDLAIDAKSMVVKYRQDATDTIRANDNSVRAFIVRLRERLPTTLY